MEQIVEKKDNINIHMIAKMVKKLKFKEKSLKNYSMKLAEEYLKVNNSIDNLIVERNNCKELENQCIDGLYKQHITIFTEPKMKNFYDEYDYKNLMEKYEKKMDDFRKENQEFIEVASKKELILLEKSKIIDMLSRQFASSNFERLKLLEVAELTKRDFEKLYKKTKEIIENELDAVLPEEREILKDNHLGKLQYIMTNYWYEKENNIEEVEHKKHKFNLLEWLKHLFKSKQPKLLEEATEEKRERKLHDLEYILKNVYYEVEYAGCFKSGKIEDKVHIMQIDEANIKSKNDISERREMLKEEILVKI